MSRLCIYLKFVSSLFRYNGNGRGNLLWNPDNGLLAYTSGAIVILEHLADSKKHYLRGHTEEIACLAMQYDGQVSLASKVLCHIAAIVAVKM